MARGGWPHVVFLHAGIADQRAFTGVMELLSPDVDVLAYDRRGFGATTYRRETHDPVADLCAVLDAAGMDRAVLVGNSQGGQIALNVALTRPQRVSGLVLVAPGVSGAPETADDEIGADAAAIWATLEAAEAAGDLDALNRGEIRLWLDGPTAPEGRIPGAIRQLVLDMNHIALHAPHPGREREPPDAWSRLAEVGCPTLVVAGDLDLPHFASRCRFLVEHMPNARLEVMPGVAHLPALEQPEAFARLLRGFLQTL
jgi:pimeloyl-ACP methyl ester carboxylesterase